MVYEKSFFKKNIYPEIVKQIICSLYLDKYGHHFDDFKVLNALRIGCSLKILIKRIKKIKITIDKNIL